MRFTEYAFASTLFTATFVFYAYATRLQFYPAVIYLVTSKPAIMVLGNMAFVFTIALGQLTNKIFLGRLREVEREIIWENLRYAFTETCLALSTFREEMSLNVVIMFTALLFAKVFHWLCEARVEHLEQAQETSRLAHVRTVSLMAVLLFADVCCAGASLYVVQTQGASVQVFFGFEYVLLAIKVVEVFIKYCLAAIDMHFIQGQWYNKSLYEMYLKLIIDVAQLFVNVVFFAIIFTYYGVPLHLMRQLYIAFKNVHDRLAHFWRFRRITANLHDRFPNATEEDLEATDRVCIICREEMVAGTGVGAPKKLRPCGHIFHFYCLRNWLERQLKCPTCRTDISTQPLPTPANQNADNNNVNGNEAAPANNDNANNNNNNINDNNENADDNAEAAAGHENFENNVDNVGGAGGNNRARAASGNGTTQGAAATARAEAAAAGGGPQGRRFTPAAAEARQGGAARWRPASREGFGARPRPRDGGPAATAPTGPGMPSRLRTPPPFGFPMGLPATEAVTGASVPSAELPSVAQYLQSQIEILQLQLQVYQAQANAAHATRRAAVAAMRAREFHARQQGQGQDGSSAQSSQPTGFDGATGARASSTPTSPSMAPPPSAGLGPDQGVAERRDQRAGAAGPSSHGSAGDDDDAKDPVPRPAGEDVGLAPADADPGSHAAPRRAPPPPPAPLQMPRAPGPGEGGDEEKDDDQELPSTPQQQLRLRLAAAAMARSQRDGGRDQQQQQQQQEEDGNVGTTSGDEA